MRRAARASLRSQVPVQPHFDRKTVKPEDFTFDRVAHCEGSAKGQFCKTLTGTSPYSGCVEERVLLNRANTWVADAIEDIRSSLPFPLTAGHYDNGIELINKPLLEWCLERHTKVSLSRPYRKNDRCFAEQKITMRFARRWGISGLTLRLKRSDFGQVLDLRNRPLFG
jgi:hypothetical protein